VICSHCEIDGTPSFGHRLLRLLAPERVALANLITDKDKRSDDTCSRYRFGSVAVFQVHSSRTAALGWKADTRPGLMSALTNTGRSDSREMAGSNVS
jgi:hypothetical protein